MDRHVYFKANRLNKFTQEQLAEECGVERQQIRKSLKYLRDNNFLITIGPEEYVNPYYCYQCGPEVLKQIQALILDEGYIYTEDSDGPIKKPSYWPRFNFKKIKPAREGDENDESSKRTPQTSEKHYWMAAAAQYASKEGDTGGEDEDLEDIPW